MEPETNRIERPPLPFEPEPIEAMRARLQAAIGHVNPYGARLQLAQDRRHAFDFADVSPQRGNRLVLSVDDSPEIGPKLQVSLWSIRPDGSERPLIGDVTSPNSEAKLEVRLRKLLRMLTGVHAEPFIVFGTGPPGSERPHGLFAFFRYSGPVTGPDFPSLN